MNEMTGRCLCGAVHFTASGVETGHNACHCEMCRRWAGGPLLATVVDGVRFIGGEHVAVYSSSEWADRGFCAVCGSNLFYRLKESGGYHVCIGAFDDPSPFQVVAEIFVDAKPPGYAFAGEHPRLTERQYLEKLGLS